MENIEQQDEISIIYKNEIIKIEKRKKNLIFFNQFFLICFLIVLAVFIIWSIILLLQPHGRNAPGPGIFGAFILIALFFGSIAYLILIYAPGKMALRQYTMLLNDPEKMEKSNAAFWGDFGFLLVVLFGFGFGGLILAPPIVILCWPLL